MQTEMDDLAALSEPELIQLAQARDEAALDFIYEQNHARIFRYILARVGKREDAEDLTSDVFVKMLGKVSEFNWRGITLSAWLFRIAHNVVVDHLRRLKHPARQAAALEFDIEDVTFDVDAEVEKCLAMEEVMQAVEQLPSAQREVLHLRFAAGLNIAETSQTLGKNEGTVKVLQYNAIHALRRQMAGQPTRARAAASK